jgi:hypothetical protein
MWRVKPRTVVTTKILSVASVALAACASQAPPPDREPPPKPTQTAHEPPQVPPDKDARPDLLLLRAELDQAGRANALARAEHFRPLCDADGYPLVGNIARKHEPGTDSFGPTAFCAAIREKKATRS